MKTNGATWNAYMASWPENYWFDDSDETFDGKTPEGVDATPDAVVEFSCGVVYCGGLEIGSLTSHFKKWLKAQSCDSVVCQIPKEHRDALKAFLKQHGGKEVA